MIIEHIQYTQSSDRPIFEKKNFLNKNTGYTHIGDEDDAKRINPILNLLVRLGVFSGWRRFLVGGGLLVIQKILPLIVQLY